MTLDITALDALIAGLSTAFFGGLIAASAYLLRQLLAVQNEVREVRIHLAALQRAQDAVGVRGERFTEQPLTGAATKSEVP